MLSHYDKMFNGELVNSGFLQERIYRPYSEVKSKNPEFKIMVHLARKVIHLFQQCPPAIVPNQWYGFRL